MNKDDERKRFDRFDRELVEVRAKLNMRRAELREQELERRKREFDRMPLELRKAYESVGWSPYQDGAIVYRLAGTVSAAK